jgi:ADP-ribose pyrophosphatase YjhB (NUDIX family)
MSCSYIRNKAEGIFIGIALSVACYYLFNKLEYTIKDDKIIQGDDNCNSLFYGSLTAKDGSGFPQGMTIDNATVATLKTVHPEYTKLPMEMYKKSVECLPIVCVDVICRRKADGKLLLFFRRDKPAAGIWWWPGGRMFRGETFFDCAVRKIRDESGSKSAKVTPLGIVNVWNTFFPDSNWDEHRPAGREGTQTVNICVACEIDDADIAMAKSEQAAWAVEASAWITPEALLQRGAYDKYVSLNVQRAIELGYL